MDASQLEDEVRCVESAGDGSNSEISSAAKAAGRIEGVVQVAAANVRPLLWLAGIVRVAAEGR